jgi:hypothetical protein
VAARLTRAKSLLAATDHGDLEQSVQYTRKRIARQEGELPIAPSFDDVSSQSLQIGRMFPVFNHENFLGARTRSPLQDSLARGVFALRPGLAWPSED